MREKSAVEVFEEMKNFWEDPALAYGSDPKASAENISAYIFRLTDKEWEKMKTLDLRRGSINLIDDDTMWIITSLLERGITDQTLVDFWIRKSLQKGVPNLIDFIIKKDLLVKEDSDITYLHEVINSLCLEPKDREIFRCLSLLLAAGADVNQASKWYGEEIKPIHMAAKSGQIEIFQTLLDHGAVEHEKTSRGRDVLRVARDEKKVEMVAWLEARDFASGIERECGEVKARRKI